MTGTALPAAEAIRTSAALARRFEAIVFDWDGTAVPDRRADAERVRRLVEQAIAHGLELAIVSGAEVGSIDRQLGARPAGPGGLILALNHGSEGFSVDLEGPKLAFRRTATADEGAALSRAAELTVKRLLSRGLQARVVSEGLNRRKVDLIPDREWEDPPRVLIADLLGAVEGRLAAAGIAGQQRGRENRQRLGGRGRTRRSTGEQRRQVRRDRADRHVRLGAMDHSLAVGARDRARPSAGRRR